MHFRHYQLSDDETLVSMFNDFQDYIASIDPLHKVRRLPQYGKIYLEKTLQKVSDHEGNFLLVEVDEEIAGFIVGIVKVRQGDELLEEVPSTYGEVIELYLAKKYRSQEIGSELMRRMEMYFLEKKCDTAFIEVFGPNTRARTFYEKHGYGIRDLFLSKELNP